MTGNICLFTGEADGRSLCTAAEQKCCRPYGRQHSDFRRLSHRGTKLALFSACPLRMALKMQLSDGICSGLRRGLNCSEYEKDSFAPPRRERLEQGEQVYGLDRCGPDGKRGGRGQKGGPHDERGRPQFRNGVHLLSETCCQDAQLCTRYDEPRLDSRGEELAAEREALRYPAGAQ